MKRGINAWCFPAHTSTQQMIEMASRAGFETLEFAVGETGDISLESTPQEVGQWAKRARAAGLGTPTMASGLFWRHQLSSSDPEIRARGESTLRHLLESASAAEVDTVLVVPGVVTADEPYDQVYQRSQESLAKMAPVAEQLGVRIGVENVWNKFLLSPLETARYVDEIGSDYVGVYFDVGNVLQVGFPEQWVRILGKRVFAVHVKDFNSNINNIRGFVHLLQGDVAWERVMAALREIGYAGSLTCELPAWGHGAGEKGLADMNSSLAYIIGL